MMSILNKMLSSNPDCGTVKTPSLTQRGRERQTVVRRHVLN